MADPDGDGFDGCVEKLQKQERSLCFGRDERTERLAARKALG